MADESIIKEADFFTNDAGREAGFTANFWLSCYDDLWDWVNEQAAADKPFGVECEGTLLRKAFGAGFVDVFARVSDVRDVRCARFTVFPPVEDDLRSTRKLRDWRRNGLEPLGEGVLADAGLPW